MKIAIIGSRKRNSEQDFMSCEMEFKKIYNCGDTIVSGGCKFGGDKFAEILASKYSVPIKIFYADWEKNGKSAGFLRNSDIAENSDIVLAVVEDEKNIYIGGTGDTIKKAIKLGKKIVLVPQVEKQEEKDPFDGIL